MTWLERFQNAVAQSRANSAQVGREQRSIGNCISDFFRQFRAFLGLTPKDMAYLILNGGQPYPMPVGETKPDIKSTTDPTSGEQIFYAAVEVKLPDSLMGTLPVWVRVHFKDSPQGWVASFGDKSASIADKSSTEAFMADVAEEIEIELSKGSIPPVKVGFV